MWKLGVLLGLVCMAAVAWAGESFEDIYADVVWTKLTGFSSAQSYRLGTRWDSEDLYLQVKNDWFDTSGTALPFQYAARGTAVSAGYRHWFPGRTLTAAATVGQVIEGENAGKTDLRVGLVGYKAWDYIHSFSDMYGELTYVSLGEDAFLNIRARQGNTFHRNEENRFWIYAVEQVWKSGEGTNGTDNRIEAGVGISYIFARGNAAASFDFRGGYDFTGSLPERTYLNPTLVVTGSF